MNTRPPSVAGVVNLPAPLNGADVQIGATEHGFADEHVPGGTARNASRVPVVPVGSLELTTQTTPVVLSVPSEVTTGEPEV